MTRVRSGAAYLRREGAATRKRIRDACRQDRARLTEDARARREALRDAVREERAALRGRCALRLREARDATDRAIEDARKTAVQLDRLRQATRTPAQRAAAERARMRLAERIRESDDEVARNLSDELRPVWQKVRGRIKPSPRRTRTEAFLEWVEEHPGDAARIYDEHIARTMPREETESEYEARRRRPRAVQLGEEEIPF